MEDSRIIDLYWQKDSAAISESARKYGAYCFAVADNILHNTEDTEECVNDTWMRAWNMMPPQRPHVLRMFLAKITRNLAFDRFRVGDTVTITYNGEPATAYNIWPGQLVSVE